MKNTLEEFPTLESIKADYPDSITSARNVELVEEWKRNLPEDKKIVVDGDECGDIFDTDELYPQCNYCIGGALQMAFGVKEPSFIDDWENGIFPRVTELAETLHYFCYMPFASAHDDFMFDTYECPFPQHSNREFCIIPDDSKQTAYSLASAIIDANDAGRFEEAWDFVGKALSIRGAK